MNSQQVIEFGLGVIYATSELALPLLVTALVIGLLVSIFQAATQINEATLSFLPKVAAMIAVLAILAPWMTRKAVDYTVNLYEKIPMVVRQR